MITGMRFGFAIIAIATSLAACSSSEPAATGQQAASIGNSCINPVDIQSQDIISDKEIRFQMRNGDVWVNTLARQCPNLKFQGGFTWEVRGGMVCSNQQTIFVKDHGTPCQLGTFTRLQKSE